MQFNFDISSTRNCLLHTEGLLRNLLSSILTREYGLSWENDSNIGWSKAKKNELEKRRESKRLQFPNQSISPRLIDYSYISDIKYLISKNEVLFRNIIKDWNSTMAMLDILIVHRNNIMHREDDVLTHQHHLCLGICGELMLIVEHWNQGYSRRVLSYECDIGILKPVPDGVDVEDIKNEALSTALSCLENIRSLTTIAIRHEKIKNQDMEIITTSNGDIAVSEPGLMGQSYASGKFERANIHISSKSLDAIELILKKIEKKYWTFKWVLSDGFDVGLLDSRVKEITGRGASSTSGSGDSKTGITIGSASYYIYNDSERTVRVDISGSKDSTGEITLVDDSTAPYADFVNMHRLLSPDLILSIIYGETAKRDIRELIRAGYG